MPGVLRQMTGEKTVKTVSICVGKAKAPCRHREEVTYPPKNSFFRSPASLAVFILKGYGVLNKSLVIYRPIAIP